MMRKFLWIFLAMFLFISSLLSYTYIQAMKPLKNSEDKAIKIVLEETDIISIEDFEEYHGLESVLVVKGKNKRGESLIAWIPENKEELAVIKEADGIKAKEAIKKVQQLSKPSKILDVRLGMEKGIPLWEIYYLSDSNLINYYHVDFETGEWLKKIENL